VVTLTPGQPPTFSSGLQPGPQADACCELARALGAVALPEASLVKRLVESRCHLWAAAQWGEGR